MINGRLTINVEIRPFFIFTSVILQGGHPHIDRQVMDTHSKDRFSELVHMNEELGVPFASMVIPQEEDEEWLYHFSKRTELPGYLTPFPTRYILTGIDSWGMERMLFRSPNDRTILDDERLNRFLNNRTDIKRYVLSSDGRRDFYQEVQDFNDGRTPLTRRTTLR